MAKWLYKSYKDFIESDNKHLIGDEIIIDNGPGYYRIKFPYFVQISSDMLAGKMEKLKMTREEALEKIKPPRWYGDEGQRGWLLDSLEALGLLKFEERPTPECIFSMMFDSISADRPHTKAKELSNWLDRMGYKIVDK